MDGRERLRKSVDSRIRFQKRGGAQFLAKLFIADNRNKNGNDNHGCSFSDRS